MSLFNIKSKEEKIAQFLEKYGLNVDKYNSQRIREENAKNLISIASDLLGKGFTKTGFALSLSPFKSGLFDYLNVLTSQNWILIRQNELILRSLLQKKAGPIKAKKNP